MDRTITVTGKGRLSLAPDMIRVSINFNDVHMGYETAVLESQKRANRICDALYALGFAKQDVLTTYYDMDTSYKSVKGRNGEWVSEFEGYRVSRSMALEFARDDKMLGKVIGALIESDAEVEFHLNFFLKDTESIKSQVLARAVEDVRSKAVALTSAAGVELCEIISINHSWGEVRFDSRDYNMPMCTESAMFASKSVELNIEPEAIDVGDSVTVIWRIA